MSKARRRLVVLLVILAAVLPYARTLDVPFTFDDEAIAQEAALRPASLAPAALAPAAAGFPLHRWLPRLTLAVNHALGGPSPAGYHLFNLAVHAAVALLVLALAAEVLARAAPALDPARRGRAALLAALLFAIHPLQTMAVTYVSQRMASLAALLALASLLAWARGREASGGRRVAWLAGSAGAAALALGCKENAAVLPLLVLAYEGLVVGGLGARLRARAVPAAALALAAAGLLSAAAWGYRGVLRADTVLGSVPLLERLLLQPRVLLTYLARLALPWPGWLHLDYGFSPSRGLLDPPATLAALLLVVALAAAAALARRRLPVVAFGVAFFLLALTVEQTVLPLDPAFEHRVYLPSFGPLLAVAWGLERVGAGWRWGPWTAAAPLLLLLAAGTAARNEQWRDPVALHQQDVDAFPRLTRPLLALGSAWHARGDREREEAALRRLLTLDPQDYRAWSNLAQLALLGRQPGQALALSARAVELAPGCAPCWHNRARALLAAGDDEGALECFRRAVALAPEDHESRTRAAVLLMRHGQVAEAIEELRRALAVEPASALAWANLSAALRQAGQRAGAVEAARRAVALEPGSAAVRGVLEEALRMPGR